MACNEMDIFNLYKIVLHHLTLYLSIYTTDSSYFSARFKFIIFLSFLKENMQNKIIQIWIFLLNLNNYNMNEDSN